MNKYTLLLVLNVPFVIFGYIKAIEMYSKGSLSRISLLLRVSFWSIVLVGLIFINPIYNFLVSNDLTNSTPLSIMDVVLATGVNFCLFLCVRLYAKADSLERQLTNLHEEVSIINSTQGRRRNS